MMGSVKNENLGETRINFAEFLQLEGLSYFRRKLYESTVLVINGVECFQININHLNNDLTYPNCSKFITVLKV